MVLDVSRVHKDKTFTICQLFVHFSDKWRIIFWDALAATSPSHKQVFNHPRGPLIYTLKFPYDNYEY